jgi:hypothetical protein
MTPIERLQLDIALFALGIGALLALAIMVCGDLMLCVWHAVRKTFQTRLETK